MRTNKSGTYGFTLVELLITIAILGVLVALSHSYLSGSRERSRDSARIVDVGKVSLALDFYYEACKQYPATLVAGASNGCPSGTTLGTYLTEGVPADPLAAAYGYATSGAGSGHDAYVLRATFEADHAELSRDLDGATSNGVALDCDDSPNRYYCIGS